MVSMGRQTVTDTAPRLAHGGAAKGRLRFLQLRFSLGLHAYPLQGSLLVSGYRVTKGGEVNRRKVLSSSMTIDVILILD